MKSSLVYLLGGVRQCSFILYVFEILFEEKLIQKRGPWQEAFQS